MMRSGKWDLLQAEISEIQADLARLDAKFPQDAEDFPRDEAEERACGKRCTQRANLSNQIAHRYEELGNRDAADEWFERKHHWQERAPLFGEPIDIDPNSPMMLSICLLHYIRTKRRVDGNAVRTLQTLVPGVYDVFDRCKAGDVPSEPEFQVLLALFAELARTFDLRLAERKFRNGMSTLRDHGYIGEIGGAAEDLRRMLQGISSGGMTPGQRQTFNEAFAAAEQEILAGWMSASTFCRCFRALEGLNQIETPALLPLLRMLQNAARSSRRDRLPKMALCQLKTIKFKVMQMPITTTKTTVIMPAAETDVDFTRISKELGV